MLSSSFALDSSEAVSWRSKSARYSVIFSLTSCFMVPQKDFRFFAPCSSEYQTTPFQRPSDHLKIFPLANNFHCILRPPFLSNTQYRNCGRIATLNEDYYQKVSIWEARILFTSPQNLKRGEYHCCIRRHPIVYCTVNSELFVGPKYLACFLSKL